MLKTMKNQMLPERGEGCRCKGKTPKTYMYVCMYTLAGMLHERGHERVDNFQHQGHTRFA